MPGPPSFLHGYHPALMTGAKSVPEMMIRCGDSCVARIPCVGKKIKETSGCKGTVAAPTKRSWNSFKRDPRAEQYELAAAKTHLARACELAKEVCDYNLHAEFHDVCKR